MINFISLCRDLNIPYAESGHHHCHEGWIQVHCPFCGSGDSGFHLGFSIEHGNMNCWRCGKHTLWRWLRKTKPSINVSSTIKKYESRIRRTVKKEQLIRKRDVKPPIALGPLKNIHRKYLTKRNYDADSLISSWKLMGTGPYSLSWSWRIVAPVYSIDHRIIAYVGRALSDDVKPKWKMTDNKDMPVDPKTLIYGIQKTSLDNGVLIVEGPGDVWRMGPGAVALFGIDWCVEQAHILRQYKRRFILFDPEPTAQKRAEELGNWLSAFPGTTEVLFDLPCDPGALTQKEADKIMREIQL